MRWLSERWVGWISVVIALISIASVTLLDVKLQSALNRAHDAVLIDVDNATTLMENIDSLLGQALAAIELSVLATDSAGGIQLDPAARQTITTEVQSIQLSAASDLSDILESATKADIRLNTLALLAATRSPVPTAPNVRDLRSTVFEATTTSFVLLTSVEGLSAEDVESMRGRIDGARQLRSSIDTSLIETIDAVADLRRSIRWRIHLLAFLALLALGWFGYHGWRAATVDIKAPSSD